MYISTSCKNVDHTALHDLQGAQLSHIHTCSALYPTERNTLKRQITGTVHVFLCALASLSPYSACRSLWHCEGGPGRDGPRRRTCFWPCVHSMDTAGSGGVGCTCADRCLERSKRCTDTGCMSRASAPGAAVSEWSSYACAPCLWTRGMPRCLAG